MEDWYKFTVREVRQFGGTGPLKLYGYSLIKGKQSCEIRTIICHMVVTLDTKLQNISQRMQRNLKENDNRASFVCHSFKYARITDTTYEFLALQDVYPSYKWDLTKFQRVSQKHWQNLETQRAFFDNLAKELQIQSPEDWHKCTKRILDAAGGGGILRGYGGSITRALASIYPEHKWRLWTFYKPTHTETRDRLGSVEFVKSLPSCLRGTSVDMNRNEMYRRAKSGSLLPYLFLSFFFTCQLFLSKTDQYDHNDHFQDSISVV